MRIGANYLGDGRCEFVVWAPLIRGISLKMVSPPERIIPMEQDRDGHWKRAVSEVYPKMSYLYRLEDEVERPDPASHFQPEGIHGPSQVVDHKEFNWEDEEWKGIQLSEMIIYELHVGTFTPEGTFDAAAARIADLKEMGVSAIEIMPVAQFPGGRNWGYDGTYPFAVQDSYGGPDGLKRLVNESHKRGVAVILDVVYNHLGPEGNYLWNYGPYFTAKYRTQWGEAINFDGAYSNGVRNFFIENALHWFENYHIDALRLDAVHSIVDVSARPFLQGLAERVKKFSEEKGRDFYLIAESDLNDSRVIKRQELGGYGIDAQWCDDFHHAIHTAVTAENRGYYIDFGSIHHLVTSLRDGFVYSGQYSKHRKMNHGNSSKEIPAEQFIIFSQNHDQVGNRMNGERLTSIVSFEALKLMAGMVLLSPYIPLLFMGEEYGEDAPFLYFVSHFDPDLIEAVREGRKEEFKAFGWRDEPPDPQSMDTFIKSKINWHKRVEGRHKVLLHFYKTLIRLRKSIPALSSLDKKSLDVCGLEDKKVILMRRWDSSKDSHAFCLFNFSKRDIRVSTILPATLTETRSRKKLDSANNIWDGPGSSLPDIMPPGKDDVMKGESLVLYVNQGVL